MTLTAPDFSHLTVIQFAVILLVLAAADWVTGVLGAIRAKAFSVQLVLQVLRTHVLLRVAPIAALFALGQIGSVLAVVAIADAALGVYFVETVLSMESNLSAPATTA